jgi:hypothetical protein
MSATLYCPWCGAEMAEHKGRRCPEMSNILVDSFRAAMSAERAARIQDQAALALHDRTMAYKIDNTAATPILGTDFDRGAAIIRNQDAALDQWLSTDQRNLGDPLKRITLKALKALVITTPGDLYAMGSTGATSIIEVMELTPGQYPPFAFLA